MFQVYYFGQKQYSPEISIEKVEYEESSRSVQRVVFRGASVSVDCGVAQQKGNEYIQKIKTSKEFTIMLTNQGQLWGYGKYQEGQLGYIQQKTNDFKFQQEVRPIVFDSNQKSVRFDDIFLGESYAGGESGGKVYCWGKTGRLLSDPVENINGLQKVYVDGMGLQIRGDNKHTEDQKKVQIERVFLNSATKLKQAQMCQEVLIQEQQEEEQFHITDRLSVLSNSKKRAYLYDCQLFLGKDWANKEKDRAICGYSVIKTLSHVSIKQVEMGVEHLLCCSREGEVYGMGSNLQGQLGLSDRSNFISRVNRLVLINAMNDRLVTQVAAGGHSSMFLTFRGTVYSCGQTSVIAKAEQLLNMQQRQDYYQQSEILFNIRPRLLETGDDKVILVRSGGNHYGALTLDGGIYMWGYGQNGSTLQTSIEDDFQLNPQQIGWMKGVQVVEINMMDGYTLLSTLNKTIEQPFKTSRTSTQQKNRQKSTDIKLKLHMTSHIKQFRQQAQNNYNIINTKPAFKYSETIESHQQLGVSPDNINEAESLKSINLKKNRRSQSHSQVNLYQKENLLQSIVIKDKTDQQQREKIININQFKNKSQLLLKQVDNRYHQYFDRIFMQDKRVSECQSSTIDDKQQEIDQIEMVDQGGVDQYQDERQIKLQKYLNELIITENQGQKYSYVQLIKQKNEHDFKEFIFRSKREENAYSHYEIKLNKIMNKDDIIKQEIQKIKTEKIQNILDSFIKDSKILPRLNEQTNDCKAQGTKLLKSLSTPKLSIQKQPTCFLQEKKQEEIMVINQNDNEVKQKDGLLNQFVQIKDIIKTKNSPFQIKDNIEIKDFINSKKRLNLMEHEIVQKQ